MIAIFLNTIKNRRIFIAIYSFAAVAFMWMYVAFFPYIQEKSADFDKLLEAYPESFLEAFGIQAGSLWFDKLENFLAVEQFSFVWPIMVIAMLVALGGFSIAGEIEKGTIETLLSQPISRLKIFFGKYLAGVVSLIIFTIISIFAVIPLAKSYHIDYQLSHYFTTALLGFMFGLAIFSIAALFSSLFSEKGKAYFISAGILVVMYVINILSTLKESVADLKYFSFFYYFDVNKALIDNQIEHLAYWVFLGVSLMCTALAAWWFSKRDISVS